MTDRTCPLSPRELEILQLLTEGLSRPELAERLGIGAGTVRSHLRTVYAKLGVLKTEAAVAVALRHGWIA